MTVNWHERYLEQAGWTRSTRQYLLSKIDLAKIETVLDVGCGTGALFSEFHGKHLTGLDIDLDNLRVAIKNDSNSKIIQANGYSMPICGGTFDLAYCHYVLLWVKEPIQFLQEMKRVVRPDGWLVLFAEPDYQARIDMLGLGQKLGKLQNKSLLQQGVDLSVGRRIGEYLVQIGCREVLTGVIGGEWELSDSKHTLENQVLKNDLSLIGEEDSKMEERKPTLVYVPTFYAIGKH